MFIRVRVRVRNIYFDNEKHDIEETNTETFMCLTHEFVCLPRTLTQSYK